MQSDDRKLLEDAAKAAGIDTSRWTDEYGGGFWIYPGVGARRWNPLTSDGDALRLAVKLGLVIDAGAHKASDGSANWFGQVGERDPYAATRRAIVRAAASLATPGSQT